MIDRIFSLNSLLVFFNAAQLKEEMLLISNVLLVWLMISLIESLLFVTVVGERYDKQNHRLRWSLECTC